MKIAIMIPAYFHFMYALKAPEKKAISQKIRGFLGLFKTTRLYNRRKS